MAVDGERSEQADAVDLRLGLQRDADGAGGPVEHAPQRRAGRREEEAVAGDLDERQLAGVGERVVGLGDEEQVLGEQRLDGQLRVVDGQVDDGGAEATAQQSGDERRRAPLRDDGPHARVA